MWYLDLALLSPSTENHLCTPVPAGRPLSLSLSPDTEAYTTTAFCVPGTILDIDYTDEQNTGKKKRKGKGMEGKGRGRERKGERQGKGRKRKERKGKMGKGRKGKGGKREMEKKRKEINKIKVFL